MSMRFFRTPVAKIQGLFVLCAVCVFGIFAVSFLVPPDPFFRAERELQQKEDEAYRSYFTTHIDAFFNKEGIDGMARRVATALQEGQITMFVCHSLAHDIGHYAGYPDHFKDIKTYLSKENLDFCGSGFMHGIEGQLANGPYPQNVDDLYTFCRLITPLQPYYEGCYHGAGHAFMENTRTPYEAMEQCDLLKTDEFVPDVTHCYRGVFSEHSDYVQESGGDGAELLAFCSSLDASLQQYCAEELNGLHIPHTATDSEVETALRLCSSESYTTVIQHGCVRSVASVATDHMLGEKRALVPASYVASLSPQLRLAYIDATIGSFFKTAAYTQLSSASFCDSFGVDDKAYCESLIDRYGRHTSDQI